MRVKLIDELGGTSSLSNLDGDLPSHRFRGEMNPFFSVAFRTVIDMGDPLPVAPGTGRFCGHGVLY
jgi:hypothetical protein